MASNTMYILNTQDVFTAIFENAPFFESNGEPGSFTSSMGITRYTWPFYVDSGHWNFGYGFDINENLKTYQAMLEASGVGVPANVVTMLADAIAGTVYAPLGHVPKPGDLNAALSQTTNWKPASQVLEDALYVNFASYLTQNLRQGGGSLGSLPIGVIYALEDLVYNGGPGNAALDEIEPDVISESTNTQTDFSQVAYDFAFTAVSDAPILSEKRELANSLRTLGFTVTINSDLTISSISENSTATQLLKFLGLMISSYQIVSPILANSDGTNSNVYPGAQFLLAVNTAAVSYGVYLYGPNDSIYNIISAISTTSGLTIDSSTLMRINKYLPDADNISSGGLIHVPIAETPITTTPIILPKLPSYETYVYDATTGIAYTVGASLDGSNAQQVIDDNTGKAVDANLISTIHDPSGDLDFSLISASGTEVDLTIDTSGGPDTLSVDGNTYQTELPASALDAIPDASDSDLLLDFANGSYEDFQPASPTNSPNSPYVVQNGGQESFVAVSGGHPVYFMIDDLVDYYGSITIDLEPGENPFQAEVSFYAYDLVVTNYPYPIYSEQYGNGVRQYYQFVTPSGIMADVPVDYFRTNTESTEEFNPIGDITECYCDGTNLEVPGGENEVNKLNVGDKLTNYCGITKTIKWLGHRYIDCSRHPNPHDVWPVRIQAGAFGRCMPARDLFLSPDHAVFSDGVLIPIKYLINGATIVQEPRDEVTYWHVELDQHDVILAEGLPCESYLDTGNRRRFSNGGTVVEMHPDFAPEENSEAVWEAAGCAPLRIEGETVARVKVRLRRRAAKLGYQLTRPVRKRSRRAANQITATIDLAALLDPAWYLSTNPDVAAAGINAHTHYGQWAGRQEGRRPCPEVELIRALGLIDPGSLPIIMPDVIAAGFDPVEHFCAVGWTERRPPNPYFETGWYLDTHAVPEGMNPLLHYVLLGEQQGLAPSRHFDPAWYRQRYEIPPSVCALAHYLHYRRIHQLSPLPSFNLAAYTEANQATLRPDRDPYLHFLAFGTPAGPLRGYVDEVGPEVISGWAQDESQPEEPVCLDIVINGRRVARVLANHYRADLRQAGLGSGRHSFAVKVPAGVAGAVQVHRTADRVPLKLPDAATVCAKAA